MVNLFVLVVVGAVVIGASALFRWGGPQFVYGAATATAFWLAMIWLLRDQWFHRPPRNPDTTSGTANKPF